MYLQRAGELVLASHERGQQKIISRREGERLARGHVLMW